MSKKSKEIKAVEVDVEESKVENTKIYISDGRPKRDVILDAIKAGGATRESLMEAAGVNKAGLASQISYLNLIALGRGTGFPLTDGNGVFYLGTKEEYEARAAKRASGTSTKPKTAEEMLEAARKREDRASAKFTNCKRKHEASNTEESKLRLQIAELELQLASILLGKIEQGDFSSEGQVASDVYEPSWLFDNDPTDSQML